MRLFAPVVLLLVLFTAAPVFAKPGVDTEIFGAFSYQKGKDIGQIRQATFDLTFYPWSLLGIGPVLEYAYFNAPNVDTETPAYAPPDLNTQEPPAPVPAAALGDEETGNVWSIGGQLVMNTTKSHNGFQFGVAVLVPEGDGDGTIVKPWVGLAFGNEHVFMRARWSHPYNYGFDGGDYIDLERDVVDAGIGVRFGK